MIELRRHPALAWIIGLTAILAVVCGGCDVALELLELEAQGTDAAEDAAAEDAAGEGAAGEGGTFNNVVLVRFWNNTADLAVDVQFYAADEPLDTLPGDLLIDDYRVTRSIGLAGRAIIAPGMADAISYPCTENLTLGTAGGEFLEAETGDFRGAGIPRWVQNGPLGLCGLTVTFEFSTNGETFSTQLTVGD